jgi:hypothetical protein
MRMTRITTICAALVITLAVSATAAGTLDGTVKLGGIIMNQTGDRSAVQETYNIHDGFSLAQVSLNGTFDPRHYFALNLRDINLDARQGDFVYRVPGTLKLTAGFDQHRQIFSPEGRVNSGRKDWKAGAQFTPMPWLGLSGGFNVLTRDGDRLPFPSGTLSALGNRYDNALKNGEITAEVHKDRRGGAITYRASAFTDELDPAADRTGRVVSARLYSPCVFYDKWTHLVRAAYGNRKLSNANLEYTLANFQYTGVVQPVEAFRLRYNFDANRIDDQSTRLMTDRFQNDLDATWLYKYGQVSGGYGYETNDDDRTLTSYHNWRVGTAYRYGKYLNARVDYASRVKQDQEELTLLKDVEASQVRAKLQVQPGDGVVLGGGYSKRERELPDLGVTVDGEVSSAFGRYDLKGWGALSADYSFSTDDYTDLAGGFHTESHFATGRVEFERIKDLRLAGGVTYLNIGEDLDIEKSIVFLEGAYTLSNDYSIEIKYNAFNYDDYILLDRYYTANVLRINLGYNLHLK